MLSIATHAGMAHITCYPRHWDPTHAPAADGFFVLDQECLTKEWKAAHGDLALVLGSNPLPLRVVLLDFHKIKTSCVKCGTLDEYFYQSGSIGYLTSCYECETQRVDVGFTWPAIMALLPYLNPMNHLHSLLADAKMTA